MIVISSDFEELAICERVAEPSSFPTKSNLTKVLDQIALTAVIAMGLTFPLVAGEFDLSVGYTGSLCGVIALELMLKSGLGIPAAFAAAIVAGGTVGLVNGLIVTKVGVNALVATLDVGTVVVGINYAIAGGLPVTLNNPVSFINVTLGKLRPSRIPSM